MDYDTFKRQYPSSKTLERCGLNKDVFVRQYVETFNKRGPLAVGLTDVGISKLCDSGAILIDKRGKMSFVPEKADMESLYRKAVGNSFDGLFDLIISVVHRMQDGMMAVSNIMLSKDAVITIGGEPYSVEDIEHMLRIPRAVLIELIADMHTILKDDPLVWPYIATFRVEGNSVVCIPSTEKRPRGTEVKGDWEFATQGD